MYSLPAAYRSRGVWVLNSGSLATIRKLKDGTTGNYLWQPAFQAGQPETILGRPVIEAVDMDDIASRRFPIAFGDFMAGYRILDRMQLGTLHRSRTPRPRTGNHPHSMARAGSAARCSRPQLKKLIKWQPRKGARNAKTSFTKEPGHA